MKQKREELKIEGLKFDFMNNVSGSVASTKFNRFKLIKFKCHKINSIENQHFSFLSDSIFLKKKQKNRQMRQNLYSFHNKKVLVKKVMIDVLR